jgi:cell division protein FtsZ
MDLLSNRVVQLTIAAAIILVLVRILISIRSERGHKTDRSIRVIGVGGGGGNSVDSLITAGTRGVDYINVNTDAQALRVSQAPTKIQIGTNATDGLGTGGNPTVGRVAAEEAAADIASALAGSDLVVVTAGLGGGTGSGAAPVVANIAREQGALTIAIVTKPFGFEGTRRAAVAESAANELRGKVDAIMTIPNDRVRDMVPAGASVPEAFQAVDEVVRRSVQEILDIITIPGRINLDFADVRAVLSDGGSAVMSVGRASGENRAVEAARQAMGGPLIEGRMDGATSILLNVTGSSNMSLAELTAAADEVRASAHPDANIIFGATVDRALKGEVQVTLIATGFDGAKRGRNAAHAGQGVEDDGWVPPWLRDRSGPVFARPAAVPTVRPSTSETAPQSSPAAPATPATPGSSRRKRGAKAARQAKDAAAVTPTATTVSAPGGPADMVDLDVPSYLRRS